jgi:hypothetical protein
MNSVQYQEIMNRHTTYMTGKGYPHVRREDLTMALTLGNSRRSIDTWVPLRLPRRLRVQRSQISSTHSTPKRSAPCGTANPHTIDPGKPDINKLHATLNQLLARFQLTNQGSRS